MIHNNTRQLYTPPTIAVNPVGADNVQIFTTAVFSQSFGVV